MTTQSKVASSINLKEFLKDMFIGTRKRKFVSAAILLIIGFLIHIKNMKTGADQLKIKLRDKDAKKVYNITNGRKEERVTLTLYFFPELRNS